MCKLILMHQSLQLSILVFHLYENQALGTGNPSQYLDVSRFCHCEICRQEMCFQRYFQELQTWDGTGQKYLLKFLPWFEETGRGVPWHAGSCPVLIPIYHYFYYCYYFYFYYHLIPIALQDLSNLCFLSDSWRQLIRSKSPGVSPTFHIFHLQCLVLSSSCELFWEAM